LGDSAITLDFGNFIDEKINQNIIKLFYYLQKDPLPGMIEVLPAYSSLTIYYDPFQVKKISHQSKTSYELIAEQLEKRIQTPLEEENNIARLIKIPVCYDKEFGLDLELIANEKHISAEDVIQIHLSKTYHVYMLGFLPGFSYMGLVDERIEMPRKLQPRLRVEPGSVGITGRQTGIYPLPSPGGWQIVGRTPLKLFETNSNDEAACLLKPGDDVIFYSITIDEFKSY
jgi:inhibitor of KinA